MCVCVCVCVCVCMCVHVCGCVVLKLAKTKKKRHSITLVNMYMYHYISSIRRHGYFIFPLFILVRLLIKGGYYSRVVFRKPADSNDSTVCDTARPDSSTRSLSVLLSAVETSLRTKTGGGGGGGGSGFRLTLH